jgi:uncharacterized protein YfaS (alpha-2-macroglobulin family)
VDPGGKLMPTSLSGVVGGEVDNSVSFPANAIPGSSKLYLNVFPAFLSQAVSGMDSLLQTPNGCFEQTTSTTWPDVLVMDYMSKTGQITPAIQMKAESLITAGYQRLLTFEHPGGGFSWFGTQDPKPFLSVTAFGVMEFADMAKVHPIDEAMLARTINWLASQQKTDGSWEGDQSEFFSFQTSTLRNSAFVLWALAVADYNGGALAKGVDYVTANANVDSADPYTLGILANALLLTAPNSSVTAAVFGRIIKIQKTDGTKIYWPAGDTQTNMYGSGEDADITTTALIAQALIRAGGYGESVRGALEFLVSHKDSLGNYGSTQATIWTLRALLLSATTGTDVAVGTLDVLLDNKPFAKVNLTADQSDVMTTVDMGSSLLSGTHDVKLSFVGTGKASYHLVSSYNLAWADVPAEPPGPVSVAITYDKTDLALNDMATAMVSITNNTDKTENMVMVTLGVPPGFQVVGEDFDSYLTSGVLSRWESTGKQLMLYVSSLKASSTLKISYRLQATMPVTASDGGGEAHLYYEPDKISTVASTTFTVHN